MRSARVMVGTIAMCDLTHEGLHTLSHLDGARHPYLRWIPLAIATRSVHVVYHNPGSMQMRNFNLTFPRRANAPVGFGPASAGHNIVEPPHAVSCSEDRSLRLAPLR